MNVRQQQKRDAKIIVEQIAFRDTFGLDALRAREQAKESTKGDGHAEAQTAV